MTPDHGISFDTSSVLRSSAGKSTEESTVGWFRTIIPIDKTIAYQWPEHSQDWSIGTLGAIDVSVWAVAASPSGLSPDNGCILATLTSNMDLTMWSGGKNAFKGEWYKLVEVTPRLLHIVEAEPVTRRTLKAQVTCIAWSEQTDFGLSAAPPLDGSLLVVGNRAGSIAFLRYREKSIELVSSVDVSNVWVVDVAISPWESMQPSSEYETQVAYALSDGCVGVVNLRQRLERITTADSFAYPFVIAATTDYPSRIITNADGRRVTALVWVVIEGRPPVLVYCKSGIVSLYSASPDSGSLSDNGTVQPSYWHGSKMFLIPPQMMSIGSSAFHPIVGVNYDAKADRLIITLQDGTFRVLRTFSSNPCWSPQAATAGDELTGTNPAPTPPVDSTAPGAQAAISLDAADVPMTDAANADRTEDTDVYITAAADVAATGNAVSREDDSDERPWSIDDDGRALSILTRQIFTRTEDVRVQRADVNRISGLTAYDDAGVVIWAYESARPSDFSYKHDAKNNSTLVVSALWAGAYDDEHLLASVAKTINSSHLVNGRSSRQLGRSPLHLLRPILFRLQNRAVFDRLRKRTLEILLAGYAGPTLANPADDLQCYTGPVNPQLRANFRTSITRSLFGCDTLFSLRLRLALADFIWKTSEQPHEREECGVVAQTLLNAISHRVQKTLLRHIIAVAGCLTTADLPFALRLTVQATLPGSPEDLNALGNTLLTALQHQEPGALERQPPAEPERQLPAVSQDGKPAASQSEEHAGGAHPMSDEALQRQQPAASGRQQIAGAAADLLPDALYEACPACGAGVPLQGITTAVCPSGHTWPRCSVTTFILSTPHVRTCVGCSRKALLPVVAEAGADFLPNAARCWIVDDLLQSVPKCLFCGNSFVSVL